MGKIKCGSVVADVTYDTTDLKNKGWYASYASGGDVVDDSQKVGHPDMPKAKSATKKAHSIARRHACKIAREKR